MRLVDLLIHYTSFTGNVTILFDTKIAMCKTICLFQANCLHIAVHEDKYAEEFHAKALECFALTQQCYTLEEHRLQNSILKAHRTSWPPTFRSSLTTTSIFTASQINTVPLPSTGNILSTPIFTNRLPLEALGLLKSPRL